MEDYVSWLREIKRKFKYQCEKCHKDCSFILTVKEHDEGKFNRSLCSYCIEGVIEYRGFENVDASEGGITKYNTVETFEKNGRKAIKIGGTNMSLTKYKYMETGETESQLSSGFEKHRESVLQKEIAKATQQLANSL